MFQNLERESWYVGNLVRVPIFLHWSALIMVLLVWNSSGQPSGGAGLEWFLLVVINLVLAILLHELGHGLTARVLGAFGITITLWAFGGLCRSTRDRATPARELLIIGAGPAVSLGLAVLAWALAKQLYGVDLWSDSGYRPTAMDRSLLGSFLMVAYHINSWLFIFNMLPIFPMDGGQLLLNGSLLVTRSMDVARKLTLTLSCIGTVLFILWRTNFFVILANGGTTGQWATALVGPHVLWNNLFLIVLLGLMLRNAWAYLR